MVLFFRSPCTELQVLWLAFVLGRPAGWGYKLVLQTVGVALITTTDTKVVYVSSKVGHHLNLIDSGSSFGFSSSQ